MHNPNENSSYSSDSEALLGRIIVGRLGEFGDELVELVVALASRPSQLARLLQVFELQASTDLDDQLDLLHAYLKSHGRDKFLMRARYEMWKELQKGEEMLSTVRKGDSRTSHNTESRSKWAWVESDGYVGPDRRRGNADRRARADFDAQLAEEERRLRPLGRRISDTKPG